MLPVEIKSKNNNFFLIKFIKLKMYCIKWSVYLRAGIHISTYNVCECLKFKVD